MKIFGTLYEWMCCVYLEFSLLLRIPVSCARAAVLNVCLNHKLILIFLKKQNTSVMGGQGPRDSKRCMEDPLSKVLTLESADLLLSPSVDT